MAAPREPVNPAPVREAGPRGQVQQSPQQPAALKTNATAGRESARQSPSR